MNAAHAAVRRTKPITRDEMAELVDIINALNTNVNETDKTVLSPEILSQWYRAAQPLVASKTASPSLQSEHSRPKLFPAHLPSAKSSAYKIKLGLSKSAALAS